MVFTEVVRGGSRMEVRGSEEFNIPKGTKIGLVESRITRMRENTSSLGGGEGGLYPRGHSTPTPRLVPRSPDPISRGGKEKKKVS
jgi:hypothetical protein